jgi:hypothetical protein
MGINDRSRAQAFWPSVIDLEAAKATSRHGFWAATYCAGATALVVLLNAFGIELFGPGMFDAWALVDVTLFAVIAWGINRYSRTAAVLGLVIYLSERAVIWTDFGFRGGGMTLVISFLFIQGIRGTFAYHHHKVRNSSIMPASVDPK